MLRGEVWWVWLLFDLKSGRTIILWSHLWLYLERNDNRVYCAWFSHGTWDLLQEFLSLATLRNVGRTLKKSNHHLYHTSAVKPCRPSSTAAPLQTKSLATTHSTVYHPLKSIHIAREIQTSPSRDHLFPNHFHQASSTIACRKPHSVPIDETSTFGAASSSCFPFHKVTCFRSEPICL